MSQVLIRHPLHPLPGRHGWCASNAANSNTLAAAQAQLVEEPFSLVVPDVLLPDGDGIDLLREIKSTPAPVLPVILKGAMMAGTLARARRPPAFDHRKIVEYAHQRIRSKLDYTNVGFELLPDEAILGENLDKRNFRRKIIQKGIVKPTKEWQQTGRKPAQLYRFSA